MRTKILVNAAEFFAEHAGYSYDPTTETAETGQARRGRELAAAESTAAAAGVEYRWTYDDITSADHDTSGDEPYPLWVCSAMLEGTAVASLCGIDLGPAGRPCSDPYARVVRAELACEAFNA